MFAEAADVRQTWEAELKGWNVRESQVVNGWIAEGRAEGRAEERREALSAVLEERFGPLPADLVVALAACTDLARLQNWTRLALRAADLAAFRAAAGMK